MNQSPNDYHPGDIQMPISLEEMIQRAASVNAGSVGHQPFHVEGNALDVPQGCHHPSPKRMMTNFVV